MTEKELEKEIKKIFGKAYVELANKTEAYFKASERLDKKMKLELPEDEYNKWKTNRYLVGKRWEDYSEEIANDMLNADNLAREAIRGNLAVTMAEGMNRALWEASKIGTLEAGFTLYDKNAVMRLIKDKPEILPALKPDSPTERAIREGRIKRWNKQHLRTEVTQGILQGESTSKIAKRMQNVVGMEQRASMRNARTAMTSAYNGGKEAGYKEAEDMGIELEQMWVAIFDGRTRHEHRQLDGQIRKVGEPFEIDGYELMFPADPNGEPEMVYNCRCRLVAITAGLKAVDPDIYKRPENLETEEQEYEEWKHALEKPDKPETIPEAPNVIEGQPEEQAGMNYLNTVNDLYLQDSEKIKYHDESIDIVKELRGITDDKQAEQILNEGLKNLVDSSDIGVRVDAEVLDSILEEGRFKNQFETGTSKGMFYPTKRVEIENNIMAVPKDANDSDRPIYGMLFPQVNDPKNIEQHTEVFYKYGAGYDYGNTVVIFKKENIIKNSTMTLGDSLDDAWHVGATKLENPVFTSHYPDRDALKTLVGTKSEGVTKSDLCLDLSRRIGYTEVQIHGESSHSIENIEKVILNKNAYYMNNDEIIKKLKKYGIPYQLI